MALAPRSGREESYSSNRGQGRSAGPHTAMKAKDHPGELRVNFPELLIGVENDRELLRDLLETFREEFPRLLQTLQAAVFGADMKKVETTGHTLKGMLATMAFTRAAALARRLEQMGKQEVTAGLLELSATLEHEAALAVAELESFCAGSAQ